MVIGWRGLSSVEPSAVARRLLLCCALATALVAVPTTARAAYDLTISTGATTNVTFDSGTDTFAPNADGAVLNVDDLMTQLENSGVTVSTGSGGTQPGTITIATPISTTSQPPLTFQPASSIAIDVDAIETGGTQTYDGPVDLDQDTTMTSTGGDITFDSTIDGAHALTVDTGELSTFDGSIGTAEALSSLTTDASESTRLGGSVYTTGLQKFGNPVTLTGNAVLDSSAGGSVAFTSTVDGSYALRIDTSGMTSISGYVGTLPLERIAVEGPVTLGDEVDTSGDQRYDGPMTLVGDVRLLSEGAGTITLGSTVDGAFSLAVSATESVIDGAVGATTPLTDFTVGPALIGAGSVTTTGYQDYAGDMRLTADLAASSLNSGLLEFFNIDGDQSLTTSTAGETSFNGVMGGSIPLTSVTTMAGGTTDLDDTSITTQGNQDYDNSVQSSNDTTLTTNNLLVLPSAVSVQGTLDLDLGESQTIAASFSGDGTLMLSGDAALTLSGTNDVGVTIADGTVLFGSLANLGSALTMSGGTLEWEQGNTADISGILQAIPAILPPSTFDVFDNDVTLAHGIIGSGNLVKTGTGLLTLDGTSTDTGMLEVSARGVDVTGSFAGPIQLTGQGTSLNVSGSAGDGIQDVEQPSSVTVSGTVAGPILIGDDAAFTCDGGTLTGTVNNLGGAATETGLPDAPTGVSAIAGIASARVSFTPGDANCFPVTYTAAATPGSAHASGASPLTLSGLTNGESYTIGVTETNPLGSAPTVFAAGTTMPEPPGPPSATISSPSNGQTFRLDQGVPTRFACAEAVGGPGIEGCTDSNGQSAPGGVLDTSRLGRFTYSVTARSEDGYPSTAQINYAVAGPPTATISSPKNGARVLQGQRVRVRFVCHEGRFGPGLSRCAGTVRNGGELNTKKLGLHTFIVRAASADGQTASRTVAYFVVPAR